MIIRDKDNKTYIWRNAYHNPYGESLTVACAHSLEQAREIVIKQCQSWDNQKAAKETIDRIRELDPNFVLAGGSSITEEFSE